MMNVIWKIDDVVNTINRMIDLSTDLRPVFLKIRGQSLDSDPMTMIGGITTQFKDQGTFFGQGWKPLEPAYAAQKAKKYPGKTMLRKTDKLFKAAAVQNSEGNVEVLDMTKIVWGVSDQAIPYAKYAFGERPAMGFTDEQSKDWQVLIAGYLLETGSK